MYKYLNLPFTSSWISLPTPYSSHFVVIVTASFSVPVQVVYYHQQHSHSMSAESAIIDKCTGKIYRIIVTESENG